ncbi:T9SS sorting signal type C domain-containing protein [Flavobacterium sp. Sd200]|uniref:beta strand repeat-containing protein n=1 Tax=Flavobacterium sp. Sd200 TaxID=2692211 RepID=UPI0013715E40|nr:T9SS sorting signal type C domain-containing protein [Flavobacterium sp. Sd200]MXN92458.1 T9SS sorting signal type C domain-containing protein [Flavobacterium sp. Sd200]
MQKLLHTQFSKLLVLLVLLFGVNAWAQTTNYVRWNFTSASGNHVTDYTLQDSERSSELTSPTLTSFVRSNTTIGFVTSVSYHATNGYTAALSETKYLEFSITLGSGQTFRSEALTLALAAAVNSTSTAARNYQVRYAYVTGTATPTFATAGTVTNLTTTQTSYPTTIPAPSTTTTNKLTIRIYMYGNDGGNTRIYTMGLTGSNPPLSTTPAFTTTPSSLTGFSYNQGSGPSTAQPFTLSGANLANPSANSNVTITGSDHYEVSKTSATAGFASSITVPYTTATLANTTIYVRLKAGVTGGIYNSESITISGGTATATVTASGSVIAPPPVNDNCSGAISLTVDAATPTSGTFVGATPMTGATRNDVYFEFTPTVSGAHTITVNNFSVATDKDFRVYNTCIPTYVTSGSTFVLSATTSSTTEEVGTSTNFTAGTSYKILVQDFGEGGGTFDIRVAGPPATLTTSTASITFPEQNISTISASQTFTVSGSSLTGVPGNITVQSSNSNIFQVSLNGTDWAANATIPYSTRTLTATNVYVRFTPSTVTPYNASLTISGGGAATSQTVTISGAGIISAPETIAATGTSSTYFDAHWNAVVGADSYRLDVSSTPFGTGGSDIVAWNFPAEDLIADGGISANSSKTISTNTGGTVSYLTVTNATYAVNSTGWDGGMNTKYWEVEFSTTGYSSLTLSSAQRSSATGPRDFKAQYKVGSTGTWTDIAGATVVCGNAAWVASGVLTNVALPAECENKPSVYIRWVMTSNTRANGAADVPSTGTSAIDNISIKGSSGTFVGLFNDLNVGNVTTYPVTGLTPGTSYYYRVRAIAGPATSANSNVTLVTTGLSKRWTSDGWVPSTPSIIDDAVIEYPYATNLNGGSFSSSNLTVAPTGSVNVATGTTITVANGITNNSTLLEEGFKVQNNGAVVQTNATANSGSFKVIKNSNPLFRLDYTMWSSPVSGQTLGSFSPQTTTGRFYEYKYDYDATLGTNVEQYFIVDPATSFTTAKGYLIRMPNSDSTPNYNSGGATLSYEGKFTGELNNGTKTVTASVQGNRYTAVGNPYASPISVVDFFAANTNVIDATSGIYFWRKKNSSTTSSYATLTLAAYTANGASSGFTPNPVTGGGSEQGVYFQGSETNWLISQGQGFIVKTKAAPTETDIKFTNSMRRSAPTNGNQAFLRTSAHAQPSRLWLNLSNNNSFSQAAVAYLENGTIGIDYGYDGRQLTDNNNVVLYTLSDNINLAVQARPLFTDTDVVPVGFTVAVAGEYKLALDHSEGVFDNGQTVYIKDNTTGLTHNLTDADYTFTAEAGTFNGRFQIVYTTQALGNQDPVLNPASVIVYKSENVLNINSATAQINAVAVYDVHGRKLYSSTNINKNDVAILGLQVSNQVIIIEISTEKGTVNKKIVY